VAQPATAAQAQHATTSSLPEQAMRSMLLTLSRRRSLGRLATSVRFTRPLVQRFVAGETIAEALAAVAVLQTRGFATTVDVLGESVSTPEAARTAAGRYLSVLDGLAAQGLERNVSLKLTQMGLDLGEQVCLDTVRPIVEHARSAGAFVRVDMEDHTKTGATLAVLRSLRNLHPGTGVVIQAALLRSPSDVEALIAEGCSVRLCKGAYKEPASVAYADKADVDANYARLMERLLVAGTMTALATHDDALVDRAIAIATAEGISSDRFEFQMLFGVRRDLQERLVREGYRVRVYVPFGAEWYPYFMRRLAERPANVSFMLRSVWRERSTAGHATPNAE